MAKINPYTRLKKIGTEYCDSIIYRHRKRMWFYPKEKLDNSWRLSDLYERVAAAEQLGYKVELTAHKEGLMVDYIKDLPPIPWEFK